MESINTLSSEMENNLTDKQGSDTPKLFRFNSKLNTAMKAVSVVVVLFLAIFPLVFLSSRPNLENNEVRQIDAQTQPPNIPQVCDVDVELVMDLSGSMARIESDGRTKLSWSKEAANTFIDILEQSSQITGNQVRIGLTTFGLTYSDSNPYGSGVVRQTLTTNYQNIRNRINNLTTYTPNGAGTCVQCGLRAARRDLVSHQIESRPKLIVIISDGLANRAIAFGNERIGFGLGRAAAISEANNGRSVDNIIYYVIGYGDSGEYDAGTLRGVANDPDNQFYAHRPEVGDWRTTFSNIATRVCSHTVAKSCSVRSSITTSPTNRRSILPGQSVNIGTNFNSINPSGVSANVRYSLSTNQSSFTLSSPSSFNVPPGGASSLSYYFSSVNVGALSASAGTRTVLVADVYIDGAIRCSAQTHLEIGGLASAWWQVGYGDIIAARGNISSDVPPDPTLGQRLITINHGGIPIYDGIINPSVAANIGVPGWKVESPFLSYRTPSGTNYSFSYFAGKFISNANVNQATISNSAWFSTNPGQNKNGYRVYYRSSGLNLETLDFEDGQVQKIIIFVNGDVNINGKILLDDGLDYLMVIASGIIRVHNYVGDTSFKSNNFAAEADIEGIFVTDREFVTNFEAAEERQLIVRGTVIGWGAAGVNNGVSFDRNLGVGNGNYPAEVFQYAPDLILNYPPFYGERTITWKEVTP